MSILSNHYPEVLDELNGLAHDESTDADWQEYEEWLERLRRDERFEDREEPEE
jgi:hypothetical protein